jgi:lipopolysaccharide transport system ATP-binding protein
LTKEQKAISIHRLSKSYTIGKQKESSFRTALSGVFSRQNKNNETFWALKEISFDIEKGDVIGIIGRNGAGKSTMLKILSRITQPTEGRIEINGRVASLLEVGTGFHPELTGRENIYLNGTLLGMTRKEVSEKLDEIIEFSGVIKFIDTPVKHYSSGMYVRLAFSVAAHLEPEILIIDEVLAVGDAEFQKKCLGKMKDVAGEGRTVIFVSHDLAAVKNLCTRAILLEQGKIICEGSTDKVLNRYNQKNIDNKDFVNLEWNKELDYDIKSIQIKNELGNSKHVFNISERIIIELDFHIKENASLYSMYLCVKRLDGIRVFSIDKKIVNEKHTFTIDKYFLTRGAYTLQIFIQIPQRFKLLDFTDVCMFEVLDNESESAVHGSYDYGTTFGKYDWK